MATGRRILVVAGVSAWLLAPANAFAHHSVTGLFDANKPVTLRGVITRLTWENPHIWIYLDVAEGSAGVVNWAVEGAPPVILRRSGVEPSLFKIGDRVTITAYRARSSSEPSAHAFDLVLPNGRRVVIGRRL